MTPDLALLTIGITIMLAIIGWIVAALRGKASNASVKAIDEKAEGNATTIELVRKEAREDRKDLSKQLDDNRKELSGKIDSFGLDLRGELRALADRIERKQQGLK